MSLLLLARDLYMASPGSYVGFNQLPAEQRALWFAKAREVLA